MEPVLARLRLRHGLEPDRRPQPGRVEEPVLEGRVLAQLGAVVRQPGRLRLGGRRRLIVQRLSPEPRQHRRVVRVDGQLPEHHVPTLDPVADIVARVR